LKLTRVIYNCVKEEFFDGLEKDKMMEIIWEHALLSE